MAVTMIPLKSSAVAAIGHDPDANECHVRFKNGGEYIHQNVSAQEFEEFKSAPSAGKHFATYISKKSFKKIGGR